MNSVLQEISATASGGWLMGIMTAVFAMFFVGWAIWAWWPGNKEAMRTMARLPLDDDPDEDHPGSPVVGRGQ
jgi:cbb3-type cytochrome oxidase subunit 3